jgi:hypothetical protein
MVNYCIGSSTYLNIGSFAEQTIDVAIKYTVQTGHLFNIFNDFTYINPDFPNSLPDSSNGDGGDGSDKNPSFNRKVKVIGVFALGFALVVGVAKLFGNN